MFFLLALLGASAVSADQTSYSVNAGCNKDQLLRWYDNSTGLWVNNNGGQLWWNSANMLTTLADFALLDSGVQKQIIPYCANTFANAPHHHPFKKARRSMSSPVKRQEVGFLDDFYDDNAWWGLAFIKCLDNVVVSGYLNEAIAIWYDMHAAYNTSPCGGVPWQKGGPQVLAIPNELYIQLGAAISNRVGADQKFTYLTPAEQAWNWFFSRGFIGSNGLVMDGVNSNTCQPDGENIYTYNQGVILSAAAELYRATGNGTYLDKASAIANAAISQMVNGDGILVDQGDLQGGSTGDGEQFKGVFIRGLKDLYRQRPTASWKTFIQKNAQTIWNKDSAFPNGNCFNGDLWDGPYQNADAIGQSSALDCLVGALAVN